MNATRTRRMMTFIHTMQCSPFGRSWHASHGVDTRRKRPESTGTAVILLSVANERDTQCISKCDGSLRVSDPHSQNLTGRSVSVAALTGRCVSMTRIDGLLRVSDPQPQKLTGRCV